MVPWGFLKVNSSSGPISWDEIINVYGRLITPNWDFKLFCSTFSFALLFTNCLKFFLSISQEWKYSEQGKTRKMGAEKYRRGLKDTPLCVGCVFGVDLILSPNGHLNLAQLFLVTRLNLEISWLVSNVEPVNQFRVGVEIETVRWFFGFLRV